MNELINFFKDNPTAVTQVVMVLITLAFTIVLTYFKIKINRKAVIIKDQKVAIDSLVEEIQNKEISFEFGEWKPYKEGGGLGSSQFSFEKDLFQIADLFDKDDKYNHYDSELVYFGKDISEIINFDSYINNPNIPKGVSSVLVKFRTKMYRSANKSDSKVPFNFVMLRNNSKNKQVHDTDFTLYHEVAYQSYLSFKSCCKELEREISIWMKKNKIKIPLKKHL